MYRLRRSRKNRLIAYHLSSQQQALGRWRTSLSRATRYTKEYRRDSSKIRQLGRRRPTLKANRSDPPKFTQYKGRV